MSAQRSARLPVVIPAAGQGARFLPLSAVTPKELLHLGRWPLIHHALLEVRREGLGPVVVVTSPRKHSLRDYFEASAPWSPQHRLAAELGVRFVVCDTRGPGDAVLLARDAVGTDAFGVLFPDDVIPAATPWPALLALWRSTRAPVMSLRRFPPDQSSRFGVARCAIDGDALRILGLVEKPAPGTVASPHRVFGRYVVTGELLQALERRRPLTSGELQLTDAYADCVAAATTVLAAEFDGQTFDCGTPEEYAQSSRRYAGLATAHA